MPRRKILETAEEQADRIERKALRGIDEARAEDEALDAMIRQSIKTYGP